MRRVLQSVKKRSVIVDQLLGEECVTKSWPGLDMCCAGCPTDAAGEPRFGFGPLSQTPPHPSATLHFLFIVSILAILNWTIPPKWTVERDVRQRRNNPSSMFSKMGVEFLTKGVWHFLKVFTLILTRGFYLPGYELTVSTPIPFVSNQWGFHIVNVIFNNYYS